MNISKINPNKILGQFDLNLGKKADTLVWEMAKLSNDISINTPDEKTLNSMKLNEAFKALYFKPIAKQKALFHVFNKG